MCYILGLHRYPEATVPGQARARQRGVPAVHRLQGARAHELDRLGHPHLLHQASRQDRRCCR